MGGLMATAMVVGNMIGSGVFLLPALLATVVLTYGSSALLAWVVTGIGAILLALVFAKLGRAYPKTGGPYVFSREAFGGFVGFLTGWGYWIAAWIGNAAIAIAFVGYATVVWPELGLHALWMALLAVGTIWLLTLVNAAGVKQGGWVQVVTTALKFIPLALITLIGIFSIDGAHFTPFVAEGNSSLGFFEGITAAIGLTLWAFIGLESATVPAEEIRDPERTIPRATIWGTVVTTLVYIGATVAVMGIIPLGALETSNAPFADAAGRLWGGDWAIVIGWIGMIAAFGALNGWILLTARVSLAAADDGVFPRVFGRLSTRRGTPVAGLVIAAVLVTGLTFMNYTESLVDQFGFAILLATLTTVVPYAFAAAAELALFIREPERFTNARFVRDSVIALLGFGYAVWAMYATGSEAIAKGFLLLMAGIPVYLWVRWRAARRAPVEEPHVLVTLPEDDAFVPAGDELLRITH
jgi:APA family basic amino acid/polyamine antiporter